MKTVYVVDDNSLHADMAAKLVRKVDSDVCVSVFTDPFTAMSAAIEVPPDVMVLDMMMPKMDGLQLLRELRKKGIMSKAIFVSAFMKKVSERLVPSNNVTGVVGKPYSVPEFMGMVEQALGAAHANGVCG